MQTSADVRHRLVRELRLDLIGPGNDDPDLAHEVLPDPPSRWYLTGYLVPIKAPRKQKEMDAQEEMDVAEPGGTDDAGTPERGPGRRSWLPSSMGMSLLVEESVASLRATARWGDYVSEEEPGQEQEKTSRLHWRRTPRESSLEVALSPGPARALPLPGTGGLELSVFARVTAIRTETGEKRVLAVSLFLVNRRPPVEDDGHADEAMAFQAELQVECAPGFVARSDLTGYDFDADGDFDRRVGDLHYRDICEWAVGHNVSVTADSAEGACTVVRTAWLPTAHVPRVAPGENVQGVELGMEALGALADAATARAALRALPEHYMAWIGRQEASLGGLSPPRREVAEVLLNDARRAAARIREGIAQLDDPRVLDAFRTMNRAIAAAALRRRPGQTPRWYPFQLAFILLNLPGLVDPRHHDREIVDLLFFPTGGGKTEAYLGLAAFVLVFRRLVHPGFGGCGLAVLMRYTLRLLTLDQLGRAATVVCALELERRDDPAHLGTWPFEIGLWVGRAATPNRMGAKGDRDENSARSRVLKYQRDSTGFPPIPIESCPWCGQKFDRYSFRLVPDCDRPRNLLLVCSRRSCAFAIEPGLPVLTVDEPIYRRLPGFLIATLDKFAAMPWVGEVSAFFGRADRSDEDGFYGPAEPCGGRPLPAPLLPPDLIIQDELHLIAGPLGSMAGLYETALEALCCRTANGRAVRPKIVASTATVRRAQRQVAALFARGDTAIFPPPGLDRGDSFFARSVCAPDQCRLYIGLAASGRSPKVLFLRAATTLLAAALKAWRDAGGAVAANPADPYMTLVAYFNALRELGSARRIVEDEVSSQVSRHAARLRVGERQPRFADRKIGDPLELTSRVGTTEVADAKARLEDEFTGGRPVDMALATNMISVGLDVVRLGLMLVSGQPKTASEYIQATSRVGRDPRRPGLIIALLNLNKPRDRSHYEHFPTWHACFYRSVEAVSVTPFAPGALDRGLAAVTVALARLGHAELTPLLAAVWADAKRSELDGIADTLATRAGEHKAAEVRASVSSLLDDWAGLAHDCRENATTFGYAALPGVTKPLLREMLDPELAQLSDRERRFRAPRSLRDVEPNVLLRCIGPDDRELGDAT